jgi:hypothetical protein
VKIKVFGERNTGTRALVQMLKNNSKSEFYPGTMAELSELELTASARRARNPRRNSKKEKEIDKVFQGRGLLERWKHSATFTTEDDLVNLPKTAFLLTVRHPLSWLTALYRRPYHILVERPGDLVSFANLNWKTVKRENLPHKTYKPLDLYEEKLKSYRHLIERLENSQHLFRVIQFEHFVTHQEATFDELRQLLDEPPPTFKELTTATKDKDQQKNSDFYAFYYANEVWRQDYPEVEFVSNTVAPDLLEFFGYA